MKVGIGMENPAAMSWTERLAKQGGLSLPDAKEVKVSTIKDDAGAKKALGKLTDSQLNEVKDIIKGRDFTSITQRELADVSQLLYENRLISQEVHSELVRGNLQFDDNGRQTNRDELFNALEYFSGRLKHQSDFASGDGRNGYSETSGGYDVANKIVATVAQANQVINSLSYFSSSDSPTIGVREEV